jgi:hypothetical protein
MKVWYGYSKLTKKAVRKHELAIYFENSNDGLYSKKEAWIHRRIHVVHERNQSKQEREDGKHENREFTKYRYFIDEKPYKGDIDKVLLTNSEADKNHVSEKERVLIREKLRAAYFQYYNIVEKPKGQLRLNF